MQSIKVTLSQVHLIQFQVFGFKIATQIEDTAINVIDDLLPESP
jgi:hypothetical protein